MKEKSPPKRRRPRRSRGKPGKHYFTEEHEKVIIQYTKSADLKERTHLYVKWIQPAFNEMVDKIVYTFKFTNLPNIDSLKSECKIWLTTILDKFDPTKGSKAFSYFSVITKNWFIQQVKKYNSRMRREVQYDQISDFVESEQLVTHNPYFKLREEQEFWGFLWGEIYIWEKEELKENERKVLEAVKILFSNSNSIEIFNKKAIYLYLREITGLNTKQVVNNLNKLRVRYRTFKEKWNRGDM